MRIENKAVKPALPQELYEFYINSPMREGVLCWYPFDSSARVLDISSGALTDLLRSRCGRVVSTDANDTPLSNEKFDCIVALDIDDFSVNALGDMRERLTNNGRLVLAYENPFALRYWSGKPDRVKGLPYYSLFGSDGRPGKAELKTRLGLAGFQGQKWYYPLTDHWLTQEVYSDSCLPDEFLHQRFKPYIADYPVLQFDERGLYREVIRGGAFEFMCGAYLVEARINASDEPCIVDYAAVTTYREPAKRFATAVCSDGKVRKTPLHPDGIQGLHNMLATHDELIKLGINIVPIELKEESLVMPRINHPTLWDYWAKKMATGTFDEAEMFSQFDRLREEILKASKTGKCFWELVPANCFYNEEKDELTFFDQEYYWDDISPDVAITRALWSLKYPSAFTADTRTPGWLERLKARYGLQERWDELSKLAHTKTLAEVFGEHYQQYMSITRRTAERLKSERQKARRILKDE